MWTTFPFPLCEILKAVLEELAAPFRYLVGFTHRFVGLLLACMLGRSPGVGAHLHMHGVDDVEEVFHHSYTLQRGVVLGRIPIRTLKRKQRVEFSLMSRLGLTEMTCVYPLLELQMELPASV